MEKIKRTKRDSQKEFNMYMFFKFNNVTIADVCERFKSHKSYVIKTLNKFTNKDIEVIPVHFGSKTQSYFTEDEMINESTPKYTLEEVENEWK